MRRARRRGRASGRLLAEALDRTGRLEPSLPRLGESSSTAPSPYGGSVRSCSSSARDHTRRAVRTRQRPDSGRDWLPRCSATTSAAASSVARARATTCCAAARRASGSSGSRSAASRSAARRRCGSPRTRRSGSTGSSSPARPPASASRSRGWSAPRSSGSRGSSRSPTGSSRRWFTPARAARTLVARFRQMLVDTPRESLRRVLRGARRLGLPRAPGRDHGADARDRRRPRTRPRRPSRPSSSPSGSPSARLAVLPDAAHLANVEQPEAFSEARRRAPRAA